MSEELSTRDLRPLMDDMPAAAAAKGPGLGARVREWGVSLLHARVRMTRRGSMIVGASLAGLGVMGGGAMAWSAFRPIWAPNAEKAPLADVLGFALLDADFSRLPIEERMKLVMALAKRIKSMGAGDSALMAAFAAGISGKARAQLENNVRQLGMDFMASYAQKYEKAPEAEKEKTLEAAAIEWSKLAEQLTGDEREMSDEDRLKEMREQSKKDAERGKRTDKGLNPENVSNLFKMIQNDINRHASPNQRAGTQRFVRDMTRTLRGRDPSTNQPRKG